jgi:hypothetical protein
LVALSYLFGFFALVIVIGTYRQWRRMTRLPPPIVKFSVVGPDEAKKEPYPYVYVERDGSARELRLDERALLEKKFSPFDRPYVKLAYRDVVGHATSGFCRRSLLPPELPVVRLPEA